MEGDPATSNPGPSGEKGKINKGNSRKPLKKVGSDPGPNMDDEPDSTKPGPSGEKKKVAKSNTKSTVKKTSSDPTEANVKKQTVMELVCEAVATAGAGRKGASAQTIKKYVLGKKESSGPTLNHFINKALITGIEKGILSRPAGSTDMVGAKGFYVLAKSKTEKTVIKKKVNEEKPKKKAATKENPTTEDTAKSAQGKEKTVKKKVTKENSVPKDLKKKVAKKANAFPVSPTATSTPMTDKTFEVKNARKITNRNNGVDRKDASDTEIVVKKGRKSLKSYSSETDIDFVGLENAKNPSKNLKSTKTAKSKENAEKPKATKGKGAKKLFNEKEEEKNEPTKKTAKKTTKKDN